MKKNTTIFWVNLYGHHGQLSGSTPHETKESAQNQVNGFLKAAEHFPHKYAKVEGRDCWVDEVGRRIAIESEGDYNLHIYHELVAIMANYDNFEKFTTKSIRDLSDRIVSAGLEDKMEELVEKWMKDDTAVLLFRLLF